MIYGKLGKVKRLKSDCCGMKENEVYDALISDYYISVKLSDNEWTSDHAAPGFFEIIEKGTGYWCLDHNTNKLIKEE